jgi:hypothetical protein
MLSTAIPSQNTQILIGTGTAGAKTITAISLGNPTIFTSTAHGFVEGDVVTIAGLTGADATLFNGLPLSVRNVTANTFAIYINSTAKTITAAGTATPITFTNIANVRNFVGFEGVAKDIDVTHMLSTAIENRAGLIDFGQFNLEVDYDPADAGHIALRAKQSAAALGNYKAILSTGGVITFTAFVKKFSLSGGVDAVLRSSIDLRITGPAVGL